MSVALASMRVLDLTQYEAGTSGTQLLAWLGADVVKIEPPTGDPGRGVGGSETRLSQYFVNYNSNKRSVVVNLKTKAGRDLLLAMIPHYDVFVENYGPGVIEQLGIDYETIAAIKPDIIYARLKGFGLSGPYSGYNCYDWVAQAAAGAFSVTGYRDGPPLMPGTTTGDSGSGVQLALAITAAYVQKLQTGVGQMIELSMQEAVTLYMRTQGLGGWAESPAERSPNGNRRGAATTDVYPCKGGGANDYLFLFVVTSAQWDALCMAMDRSELLVDERFQSSELRAANSDALFDEIAAWTIQHEKHEAMALLASNGVPCSAVLDTAEVFADEHLRQRRFIENVCDTNGESYVVMGFPPRLSASPARLTAAPTFGRDTASVLTRDLGLSESDIAALVQSGVVKG